MADRLVSCCEVPVPFLVKREEQCEHHMLAQDRNGLSLQGFFSHSKVYSHMVLCKWCDD